MKAFSAHIAQTILLFTSFLCAVASATNSVPTTEPLVQHSNLTYVGAFRLPEGTTNQTSFDYAGNGLAFDATDNSLFITGHTDFQYTAEISIPQPAKAANPADLPTATFLQTFADALDGRIGQINPSDPNKKKIGGYLIYNGKLIVSAYSYYDGNGTQSTSDFIRSTNLIAGSVAGPFRVGTQYPGFVSGYMTLVPPEWQTLLGGPALTGNCCLNILSEQSNGPAASVFNPSQLGTSTPTPATPILGYPHADPLGNVWNVQSTLFNGTTKIKGIVFPDGTRSVLFFGRQGVGPFCYGIGTSVSPSPTDECYDPADSSKGTHAYPYVYQVWAYDADDLLKVKEGQEPEYAVKPYAVWRLSLPYTSTNSYNFIGGAAYDPNTNEIFVTQNCVDKHCAPIIQVFKITGLSTSSSTLSNHSPTAPSNVQVN